MKVNINQKNKKMKKLIFALIICGLTNVLFAQTDPVNEVFNKYSGAEGFTTVNITGEMLKIAARIDNQNKDMQFISKLDEVKILTQESKTPGYEDLNFYEEIYKKLDKSLYKELLVVREEDEHVNMLARENNGIISEFLLIVSGDDENVLIRIKGEIELSELDELSGSIGMIQSDKLEAASKCQH
jgi:hypothetical protein